MVSLLPLFCPCRKICPINLWIFCIFYLILYSLLAPKMYTWIVLSYLATAVIETMSDFSPDAAVAAEPTPELSELRLGSAAPLLGRCVWTERTETETPALGGRTLERGRTGAESGSGFVFYFLISYLISGWGCKGMLCCGFHNKSTL